jgi:hypothetical protein
MAVVPTALLMQLNSASSSIKKSCTELAHLLLLPVVLPVVLEH